LLINPKARVGPVVGMDRRILGAVSLILVIVGALIMMHSKNEVKVVPKPPYWGLIDPPVANNLTWTPERSVEIANETLANAAELYGEFQRELLNLGYSMVMGNWSNTSCQWSVWESVSLNRTYYLAYSENQFIGIRGSYPEVMDAAGKHWLCQDPSTARALVTPSPESVARAISLQIGEKMIEQNLSVEQANWTGPLPDWYLGKFSFRIDAGNGVEVLVLTYAQREQAEYARYLLEKSDRKLEILRNYGGDYYSLVVLKGREKDVTLVVKVLQGR